MNNMGVWAEELALAYLKEKGYIFLTRNYSWRMGEIDLIMKDKNILVFVEVRSLTKSYPVHPLETLTPAKIKKIKKTADLYLHKENLHEEFCRFDFIAIIGTPDNNKLEHYQDAF